MTRALIRFPGRVPFGLLALACATGRPGQLCGNLLLQQQLGDDNPETEQADEGGAGDNGFHCFCSLDLLYEGILGPTCFAEIT